MHFYWFFPEIELGTAVTDLRTVFFKWDLVVHACSPPMGKFKCEDSCKSEVSLKESLKG